MTRMFVWAALLSILCAGPLAASLPGEDINACAGVSYCGQASISAVASVDFLDHHETPVASASEPTIATIETHEPAVSAGPATAFVAPDDTAPVYFVTSRSLYSRPSLVGKRVKLAGRFSFKDGAPFIDDGGVVRNQDGRWDACSVALRTDLVSKLPTDGELVMVQGIVRMEENGGITLLPLVDENIASVQ